MMTNTKQSRRQPGFTIIELLVVIGIIVVILGILLPVVNSVRKTSQRTSTQAEMTKMMGAINNYFHDFRAFPGPVADSNIYGFTTSAGTAVTSVTTPAITGITQLSSTQNMVLGLIGGLSVSGTNASPTYAYPPSTGNPPGPGGLVTLGPQSLNPASPQQVNPYFDPVPNDLSNNGAGSYVSWTTANAPNTGATLSPVPEILDQFSTPHPIIYVRARQGGTTICDVPGTSQYYSKELSPYWIGGNNATPPTRTPGTPFPTQGDPNNGNQQLYQNAAQFFANKNFNDNVTPMGKDTFILISAGFDGIYGTTDDIVSTN